MSNTYTVTYAIKRTPSTEWVNDLGIEVEASDDQMAITEALWHIHRKQFSIPDKIKINTVSRHVDLTFGDD